MTRIQKWTFNVYLSLLLLCHRHIVFRGSTCYFDGKDTKKRNNFQAKVAKNVEKGKITPQKKFLRRRRVSQEIFNNEHPYSIDIVLEGNKLHAILNIAI